MATFNFEVPNTRAEPQSWNTMHMLLSWFIACIGAYTAILFVERIVVAQVRGPPLRAVAGWARPVAQPHRTLGPVCGGARAFCSSRSWSASGPNSAGQPTRTTRKACSLASSRPRPVRTPL